MYRALELYPLKSNTEYEQLIVTQYTRARFKALDYFLLTTGKTLAELKACTGRSNLDGYTGIDAYLEAGELFGWDLSRDINYVYANVIYSPEDIERRICRLQEWKTLTAKRYQLLAANLRISADEYISAVQYRNDRNARVYGHIMFSVMRMEQVNGYSDALDFEE